MTDPTPTSPPETERTPDGTTPPTSGDPGSTESAEERARREATERVTALVQLVIWIGVLGVVALAIVFLAVRISNLWGGVTRDYNATIILSSEPLADDAISPEQQNAVTALEQANAALNEATALTERAEDAVDATGLVLSFLEGATVLVTLAFGAAAYIGFRNSQETREEFRTLHNEAREHVDEIDRLYRQIEPHVERLEKLPEFEREQAEQTKNMQDIFLHLLRANLELRLKNYKEAYDAVQHVLDSDPDNAQALYMAGWIELQYRESPDGDAQEQGIQRLRDALRQVPNWPAAQAACGVLLRRRAEHINDDPDRREALFAEAESMLRTALNSNWRLIDLNMESFWGPLAGLLRSRTFENRERWDEATRLYERAREVTPGSSYPAGNLATMYLYQSKAGTLDAAAREQKMRDALDLFSETRRLAQAELSLVPNDYYHMMDVAMSAWVLAYAPEAYLPPAEQEQQAALRDEATIKFQQALKMRPTQEMLSVSRRGWDALRQNCPEGDEWQPLRAALEDAYGTMNHELNRTGQKSDTPHDQHDQQGEG